MAEKMTRSQVARLLGVTTKTLYTWEKEGRVEPPERDWRGWRWYTARHLEALRRIIAGGKSGASGASLPGVTGSEPHALLPALDVSARNQLKGTIRSISEDGVLAEVILDLGNGNEIVSVVTRASVLRLGLRIGEPAIALIKATEVLLAREA